MDGGRLIVHIDTSLAAGLDFAAQNNFRALGIDAVAFQSIFGSWGALEDAGYDGSLGSVAYHIRRSFIAHQQSQRIHEDGLTCTGLSRQKIETWTKDGDRMIDDGVVFSAEFEEHGR